MQTVVTRNAGRLIFGAALVLVLVGVLMVALISAIFEQQQQQQQQNCGGGGGAVGGPPTAAARGAIPARLLPLYRAGEQRYGVPWNVLGGINAVETDFGRNLAVSSAGAVGWMQFMPSTWAAYAVDGNDDGKRDPWNPEDAIPAAARYLKASGSDRDLHDAILAYNHSESYVQDVLAHARTYARGNFTVLDGTAVNDGPATSSGSGGFGYPLARRGPVIATPADHQRRPLGNWESDNAIDIAVPAGTPVLAAANATVVDAGGSPPTHGGSVVSGFNVTLRAAGNEVFYTHMIRVLVDPGERVRAGQRIGVSGYANNVEHLHVGLERGDPLAVWGDGATGAVAASNGGCASGVPSGPAELDRAVTVSSPRSFTTLPAWAMAPGHPREQVDTRILPDALWILRAYGLRVSAARESGHNTHGDGTALDMVPASGGDQAAWDRSALRLAHDIGWIDSCGASGAAPACPLRPWVRFVGYNGYPNHGDPAHCSGGCGAHIHVSWHASSYGNSALSPPSAWVRVFPVPTTSTSTSSSVPVSAPAAAGAPSQTMAVVGDSLAAGTQPDLKDDLPGWQIFTDAEAGRPLADGMRAVEAIEGTPAVLAISLFTNDDPRHTSELAAAVRRSVQGQRCVLWATIHRPPVAGVSYAAANRTLHRLAGELPALQIVAWAEQVAQHPGWIGPDHVHATATGWAARARLYATAASRCAS